MMRQQSDDMLGQRWASYDPTATSGKPSMVPRPKGTVDIAVGFLLLLHVPISLVMFFKPSLIFNTGSGTTMLSNGTAIELDSSSGAAKMLCFVWGVFYLGTALGLGHAYCNKDPAMARAGLRSAAVPALLYHCLCVFGMIPGSLFDMIAAIDPDEPKAPGLVIHSIATAACALLFYGPTPTLPGYYVGSYKGR